MPSIVGASSTCSISPASRGPSPEIGDKGGALLAFAGSIPEKDLEEIGQAIEEDCEKVDLDEW